MGLQFLFNHKTFFGKLGQKLFAKRSKRCDKELVLMPVTDLITPCTQNVTKTTRDLRWEYFEEGLYVFTSVGCEGRSKIAAYDLDKTLIKTRSGSDYPRDYHDWQLLDHQVSPKLQSYHRRGYKIVVFTNQLGLGIPNVSARDFKRKIERIVEEIGVPMQVFVAVGRGILRKPRPGMWDFLLEHKNDGVAVDKSKSFYVGDAAGRPADPVVQAGTRKQADRSAVDRLLALNLGLTFRTPEEHFLGQIQAEFNLDPSHFHPREVLRSCSVVGAQVPGAASHFASAEQELVIMVGRPGSGKSHFADKHFKDYARVNMDLAGEWLRADKALSEGRSVVIDNANPDRVSRKRCLDMALELQIPARCFHVSLGDKHAKHNNEFRLLTANKDNNSNNNNRQRQCAHRRLAKKYDDNFQEPSINEGFTEILTVEFVPDFQSKEHERLYYMYLSA